MFTLLLFILVAICLHPAQAIPEECQTNGYENLAGSQHEHRVLHFKPSKSEDMRKIHDKTDASQALFDKNWFRFRSLNASRMLEMKDLEEEFFLRNQTDTNNPKIFPCGTSFYPETLFPNDKNNIYRPGKEAWLRRTSDFFVLNDKHPEQRYGLRLTTSISCRYLRVANDKKYECMENGHVKSEELFPGFFVDVPLKDCNFILECNPSLATEVVVRNCGDFFVYKTRQLPDKPRIGKPGIYCGTDKSVVKEPQPQCQDYTVIKDPSRRWSAISDTESVLNTTKCKDDSTFPQNRWVRFDRENENGTLKLAQNCPSSITDYSLLETNSYCGALYRGWIKGDHPTIKEGRTTRTLCFSEASNCKCDLSSPLEITNCGDFYVYRRRTRDFPHCFARACTEDDKVETNPSMAVISSSQMASSSPAFSSEMSLMASSPSDVVSTMMTPASEMMIMSSQSQMMTSLYDQMMSSPIAMMNDKESSSMMNTPEVMQSSSAMTYQMSQMKNTPEMMQSSSEMTYQMMNSMSTGLGTDLSTSLSIAPSMMSSSMMVDLPSSSMIPSITTTTPQPEKPLLNLCSNYETATDDSRLGSFLPKCDLKYRPAIRFKDTNGQNLQLRENCTFKDQFDKKCTSFSSNVWLPREHPEGTDLQIVDICVKPVSNLNLPFLLTYCSCTRKEFVYIQKCTDEKEPYFVYRLFPLFNSDGDALDAKKCSLRYCADVQQGKSKTTTTTTPLATIAPEKAVFGVLGQFTIKNPFVNDVPLSQKDIDDKASTTYKFLVETLKKKIKDSLKTLSRDVTRIDIIHLSIGSLVVDYEVYGTETLNNETLNKAIQQSFSDEPNLQISTGEISFSGTIDPQSQKLKGIDLCSSEPCHQMADCTNNAQSNTFSCTCKEGFSGDGFTSCAKIELVKEVDHEWSDGAIAAVTVMFVLCFILIVILTCCLCCRSKKASYNTGFNKGSKGYSDYQQTGVPLKNKADDDYTVIRNDASVEVNANESQKQI